MHLWNSALLFYYCFYIKAQFFIYTLSTCSTVVLVMKVEANQCPFAYWCPILCLLECKYVYDCLVYTNFSIFLKTIICWRDQQDHEQNPLLLSIKTFRRHCFSRKCIYEKFEFEIALYFHWNNAEIYRETWTILYEMWFLVETWLCKHPVQMW